MDKKNIKKTTPTQDDSGVLETRKLIGCIFGNINNSLIVKKQDDFYTLKGVLESLFDKLGLSKRIIYSAFSDNDAKNYEFIHPAQGAMISILGKNKEPIGYIGKLHPILSDKLKFNQALYIFEINLEEVISALNPSVVKYKKLPIYGAVQRDIAFSAPKEITVDGFSGTIKINK